jgi:small-conductance mechanosensitive channel
MEVREVRESRFFRHGVACLLLLALTSWTFFLVPANTSLLSDGIFIALIIVLLIYHVFLSCLVGTTSGLSIEERRRLRIRILLAGPVAVIEVIWSVWRSTAREVNK